MYCITSRGWTDIIRSHSTLRISCDPMISAHTLDVIPFARSSYCCNNVYVSISFDWNNMTTTRFTKSHMRPWTTQIWSACVSVKSDQTEDGKNPWQFAQSYKLLLFPVSQILLYILAKSSNRSARIIFQETHNSKISENSDNKTGDHSSLKITKTYFQKKSSCNFFGQKMESTLPKYAPSISQLLIIPCIGHSKSHFLPLVLNGKRCWFVSVFFFFLLRFISDNVFIKGEGVSLPTSVSSISIQCMEDELRLTVLTTWRLIRKDPKMSESLENDR